MANGKVYAYFTIEEDFPEAVITKENGVIGIDINAYPNNVAWAEADGNGQLVSYGKIPMPELASGSSDKREYYRWQYAHEVVRLAEEKEKAIAIERLDIRDKGRRGDFSGRKSRRIRHNFSCRSLLDKVKDLDADELEELKEHVKRTVKNKQLKKRQLKGDRQSDKTNKKPWE